MILRELLEVTDIDFVAFPPRGESVEDLSRKEIIKALRNKVPIEYVLEDRVAEYLSNRDKENKPVQRIEDPEVQPYSPAAPKEVPESSSSVPELAALQSPEPDDTGERSEPPYKPRSVFSHISEVRERGVVRMLSGEGDVVLEMPVSQIEESSIPDDQTFQGVVIDQDVNQQLLDQLSLLGIKFLAAPSFTGIVRRPASVRLIPFR